MGREEGKIVIGIEHRTEEGNRKEGKRLLKVISLIFPPFLRRGFFGVKEEMPGLFRGVKEAFCRIRVRIMFYKTYKRSKGKDCR